MQTKHRLMVALALVALVALVAGGLYAGKKYGDSLSSKWMFYYGNFDISDADDAVARSEAETMRWFSPSGSAFFLGHMAVSDAITLSGEARRRHLAEALAKLERYDYPDHITSEVDFLKAALSAMLGDRAKTLRYASEGCAAYRPVTSGAVCIADYDYDSRLGDAHVSRWAAVQLYEQAQILKITGGKDRDDLRLGETVALVYFDRAQSRQLRDAMLRDGALTGERRTDYCRTIRYRDKDAVDLQLCGATQRWTPTRRIE